MKLLIVDDSAFIRKTIMSVYKNTCFTEIETASDGMLAIAAFKKFLPDIVTLDITMPYLDGLSALSQMLEIKPNTSILTISALADYHTAIESLSIGAHQFVCKPFTEKDLKEALDNILKERTDLDTDSSIHGQIEGTNHEKIPHLIKTRTLTPPD